MPNAKFYKKHAERLKKQNAEYYKRNRRKVLATNKRWNDSHPEKMKEASKKWAESNPEEALARYRRYQNKNRELCRARCRDYQKRNPEVFKAKNNKYTTSKTGAGGSFAAAEWKALCKQCHNRCLCCGKRRKLTADHVIPVSKGGSSNIENIQPLCQPCNSSKGNKTIDYRRRTQ
jgi:5-methylcytosine-specific restriction endonuclease McrA